MFTVSTMTQFIMLITFALTLNVWGFNSMLLFMAALFLMLAYQKNQHFFRMMKRLKWFYLIMFLIFLLNTPGEHMLSWSSSVRVTFEGLQAGLEQILRITLMLAALSIILAQNTMQQLISGLYFLLRPLSACGVDVKRFAARLWLTLHYVEAQETGSIQEKSLMKRLDERLSDAFVYDETQYLDVTLETTALNWLDYIAIFSALVALVIIFIM